MFRRVNFNIIKKMMHLNLIPKLHINNNKRNKYKICIQAKQPRNIFKLVEKKTILMMTF